MNHKSDTPQPVYNWHGKRILIVEDDYVNYLYYQEILSCSYPFLIRAVSLQEAFDMLTSGTYFDLVIMNTAIPGNEHCRSVKRIKLLWPHLRLIALTGCDCQHKQKRCLPTGCDTMISSSIDGNDLQVAVNEMFSPVN
jgi:CheY-like chemotaxis protein